MAHSACKIFFLSDQLLKFAVPGYFTFFPSALSLRATGKDYLDIHFLFPLIACVVICLIVHEGHCQVSRKSQ